MSDPGLHVSPVAYDYITPEHAIQVAKFFGPRGGYYEGISLNEAKRIAAMLEFAITEAERRLNKIKEIESSTPVTK